MCQFLGFYGWNLACVDVVSVPRKPCGVRTYIADDLAESGLTLRSARGVTLVAAAVKVVFVWGSAAAQSEAGGECCQDEYADADEGDAYGSAAARRVRAGRVRCGHWVYTSTTGSVAGVWGVDRRRIR
jgi:hypothetical protein